MVFRGILILILMLGAARVSAEVGGTWGVGVGANYELPVFKLNQWFPSGGAGLGGALVYVMNDTWTVEVAGNWAKYNNGELEDRTFLWSVDGKEYASPDAHSEMVWLTGGINWLGYFNKRGARGTGGAPYVLIGTGFFHYANKVNGLVYPGQSKPPLNTALLLRPVEDKRTTLGVNLGLGYEYFASSSVAFDLRAQYHVVMGSVRPLEAWGLQEVFPFQKLDIGVQLKFYLTNQ